MNRGTANKLIDLMKSQKYQPVFGQLRYEDNYCVLGVLADFLDPNARKEGYLGYEWNGSKFYLNESAMKSCKIKTKDLTFKTDNNKIFNLVDIYLTIMKIGMCLYII